MLKTAEGYHSFEEVLEQKVEKMLAADGVLLFIGYLHGPKVPPLDNSIDREEPSLVPLKPATIEWDMIRHKFDHADFPQAVKKFREMAWQDMEGMI
ncbi:MAG: hypothetical protein WC318_07145 [Candidatus Omnitrophota bacterium]|jgi:hypothetical protein